jgi:type IV pilus assembly protein PilM
MSMRFSFSRFSAIGLDVGSRWVKAAQLSRSKAAPRLAACAVFPRIVPDAAPAAEELKQIASILKRQGFVGRDVILAAPGEKLRSGILELPAKTAGLPMDQIARAEFARVHKLEMSEAELSWWELPASSRTARGTVVMTVAYPYADAEPHLNAFEEAGFRVRAVDTPTSAIARGCLSLVEGKRSFGILDIGASAGVLVLVRDGQVVYERRIPEAAIARLTTLLEERMGAGREGAEYVISQVGLGASSDISVAERFGEARGLIARHIEAAVIEVRRTLAYASHQYADAAVETLLLCGGGSAIPGLCSYVAERVETEVRLAAFDPKPSSDEWASSGIGLYPACAIGLARFP